MKSGMEIMKQYMKGYSQPEAGHTKRSLGCGLNFLDLLLK